MQRHLAADNYLKSKLKQTRNDRFLLARVVSFYSMIFMDVVLSLFQLHNWALFIIGREALSEWVRIDRQSSRELSSVSIIYASIRQFYLIKESILLRHWSIAASVTVVEQIFSLNKITNLISKYFPRLLSQ